MLSKVRSRGLQSGLVCSMFVAAFTLTACGGGGGGDSSPTPAAGSAPPAAAAPQPAPQPPAPAPAPSTPAGAGTVSLAWTPPTEKEDGTALADLSGYRVYAGRAQGALELVASLDNPGLTRHVVENLASGTWFFAITAVARDGIESAQSNLAQKTVN